MATPSSDARDVNDKAAPTSGKPAPTSEPAQTAVIAPSDEVRAMNAQELFAQAKPIPASQVTEDTALEVTVATVSKYVTKESGVEPKFNEDQARKDHASGYLLDVGKQFNKFSAAQNAPKDSKESNFPYYGNWCGPRHSGPGAPVDTIDSLCKKHDECYARQGYFACSCAIVMVDDIARNRNKFKSTGENIAATVIAIHFQNSLCNPFK
ncbi:MAG: phospholipase A2 family protein [Corynebacterium sp.]|nr:phospholipase A2 family protein [Corynebacterium sp.]